MMFLRAIFAFTFILLMPFLAFNQSDTSKFNFDGYIYGLYLRTMPKLQPMVNNGQIINRLNFFYKPNSFSLITVQFRNSLVFGDWVSKIPSFGATYDLDAGFMDGSFNLVDEKNVLFNVNVDRLYYQYSKSKIEFTIGRQRVNWGRTLVWNPNDLFNASSFFAFDYEEKPGSDAVRLVWYPTSTTAFDLAAKIDSAQKLTAALKYDFNKLGYDIQLIGGVYQDDIAAGFGWAGNLWQLGFKGEFTYFHPVFDTVNDSQISATVSLDYAFNNGLYLLSQVLYSPNPNPMSFDIFSNQLSPRNLSFAEWSLLAQGMYPVSPLLNASLSLLYYPDFKIYIVFPTLSYSIYKDLDLSLIYQAVLNLPQNPKNQGYLFFGLKWYF